MKILLTGSKGQLGQSLQHVLVDHQVEAHDLDTLDLVDGEAVEAKMNDFAPDLVINAAAYTAVDQAESDVEIADLINHKVVRALAEQCAKNGAKLIQVSTDFVFDGQQSIPYKVDDKCRPLSVYGKTKRDAEIAIQEILPSSHIIVRTAWLYSPYGNNFVKTMLRLMDERDELRIIADQIGTPTSASSLAGFIKVLCSDEKFLGTYHWTDAGVASWYDFAVAIYEEASAIGLLSRDVNIIPITTAEYPTPADRPFYSVLDKSSAYACDGAQPLHWRKQLKDVLSQLLQ